MDGCRECSLGLGVGGWGWITGLSGCIARDHRMGRGPLGRSGLAFVTGSGTAGAITLLWLATPLALLVNLL